MPSASPSAFPTGLPSAQPTTFSPSLSPTSSPSEAPTQDPTTRPTRRPTTSRPTNTPTAKPTRFAASLKVLSRHFQASGSSNRSTIVNPGTVLIQGICKSAETTSAWTWTWFTPNTSLVLMPAGSYLTISDSGLVPGEKYLVKLRINLGSYASTTQVG